MPLGFGRWFGSKPANMGILESECQPCFCGEAPDAGNSNALGAVWSKVASLTPKSSNFCLISSGVYFLPLLLGTTAPEEPSWVVDCGKAQSGSGALEIESVVDAGVLGFISAENFSSPISALRDPSSQTARVS
jgi:hypothetical protein